MLVFTPKCNPLISSTLQDGLQKRPFASSKITFYNVKDGILRDKMPSFANQRRIPLNTGGGYTFYH